MNNTFLLKNILLPNFDDLTTKTKDVYVENGRFTDISEDIQKNCQVIDGKGMLILPGMADIHTHMVQSLTKGPLDDLNITDWLGKMLKAQWSLSSEEWYYGVLLGCLQSLRFGVTAVNEMTYFPHIDAVVQAYQDAGIRATFGIGATDIAENEQIKVCKVNVDEENALAAAFGISSIPTLIFFMFLATIIAMILLKYVTFFHQAYFIGSNKESAKLAGIDVNKFVYVMYILIGLAAAVAGVLSISRYGSAPASLGQGVEFRIISALLIGGVSLNGGEGSVLGTFLGVLLMALIANALTLFAIDTNLQNVLIGAIMVISVAVDEANRRRQK